MCVCDRVKINSEAITHNDTRRNATLSCWLFGSRSTFAPRSMSRTTLRASDRFRIIYFFFSRHVVHTCNPLTLTLAIDYDTDDKHTRLVSIFFFFFYCVIGLVNQRRYRFRTKSDVFVHDRFGYVVIPSNNLPSTNFVSNLPPVLEFKTVTSGEY